jgi:dolichol-phosphate mannosyltransferase
MHARFHPAPSSTAACDSVRRAAAPTGGHSSAFCAAEFPSRWSAKLSLIVPCYNEEAVLPKLFRKLTEAAERWDCEWEVICVNDGSRDRTWSILVGQHQADPRWRVLSLARNFGHQAAVSAGLYYCTGDAAVIIDADLQDPPEVVGELLARWREGYQVVHAVRKKRKDPLVKRSLAWGFYRVMAALVPFGIPMDAGDFCLLDRTVVDVMNALPERNRFLRGLRSWCGFRQTTVEFERHARAAGIPQYTFSKSLKLALDGVVSFSAVPLKLATHLGLLVSSFAFLGAVFTFLQKVFADQFAAVGLEPGPGFPTVVISILFLGGVQLICIGILGEYVGRIHDEVKSRPQWIIQDSAGFVSTRMPALGPSPVSTP